MTLFERTIKLLLATLIANLIAQQLSLNNAYAAGIIVILSLLDTRTDTFTIALSRFLATVLSFSIAVVCFNLLGFNLWVFTLYLSIFIPVAYKLGLQVGIAPCSMLVTHFLVAQSTDLSIIFNGFCLMVIGTGSAFLMLVWIPSQEKVLSNHKQQIDKLFNSILHLVAQTINQPGALHVTIHETIKDLEKTIESSQKLAVQEYNNQLFTKNTYQIQFFAMRKQQAESMKAMVQILTNVPLAVEQGEKVAVLLEHTAEHFGEHNTGIEILDKVASLYQYARKSDLPKTRQEFEARAMLYAFLIEFERFVSIKRDFYLKHQSK